MAANIELLSPLRTLDIKSPVIPALQLRVTDKAGNQVAERCTVEINAVSEAASSGVLPSLIGAPVTKAITGTGIIQEVRSYSYNVTSRHLVLVLLFTRALCFFSSSSHLA